MVYMYYGFFLFLLYMTSPLWIFLPVAAGSWWAMRSSFALQKNMRMSVAKLGWVGPKALGPLKALKKGPNVWVERRRFDRVAASLKVAYQVFEDQPKKEAAPRSIRHPAADSLPFWAMPFNAGEAVTVDISESGLSITGEHPFIIGEHLKLSIEFPQSNNSVLLLAEVRSSRASLQPEKTVYKAGLMILDVGLEDMVQLTDYLFDQRLSADGFKTTSVHMGA